MMSAEFLLHLARLAQAAPSTIALTPAQWMALRYFARANRASRTPSAFSEFHATTRGTASQTVKSLVEAGLLERSASDRDGRSVRFDVSPAGRAALSQDPLNALADVLSALPETESRALLARLQQVTAALAERTSAPVFGTCGNCTHFARTDEGSWCHCAQSRIADLEIASLCVQHRPGGPAPERS